MVNTRENFGWTRLASWSNPPALATATTPAMGRPMALTANPVKAGQKLEPACAPRWGGKIRFPAPKNIENSVKPRSRRCLTGSFCMGRASFPGGMPDELLYSIEAKTPHVKKKKGEELYSIT